MARPLRIDLPFSFYHVLARGNEGREIFHERRDYQRFLECLQEMIERHGVEVHAYVLMPNHYHLLLRTGETSVSRAVQWLGIAYSVWFNRKHERRGHLFGGRFKSFLVENERYFTNLCLYAHGNPLRAGLVDNLYDYEWSSCRAYVDSRYRVPWLTTERLLSMYNGKRGQFRRAQEAYVKTNLVPFDALHGGACLGSQEYALECLRGLEDRNEREIPQVKMLKRLDNVRAEAERVIRALGEEDTRAILKLTSRRKKWQRDVAMYLLVRLGVFQNREIGEVFEVGYTAVTEAAKRGRSYVNDNREIAGKIEEIAKMAGRSIDF